MRTGVKINHFKVQEVKYWDVFRHITENMIAKFVGRSKDAF